MATAASAEMKWLTTPTRRRRPDQIDKKSRIPIYISTNPVHVNPQDLRELYSTCNHSCHRFPRLDQLGRVEEEPVDLKRLQIALSHSSILVSVFCNPHHVTTTAINGNQRMNPMADFVQNLFPLVSPTNGSLVGFGRAVSDLGLTASIYDVMVTPSLQRMGIGRMIVQRIIRMLTSREIYDIAAICSENERLFFKSCGFGDDTLSSTTMMYTRTISTCHQNDWNVKQAGRKLLLIPPCPASRTSVKTNKS
ncbi:hypothetical protein HS088_TW14G00628 [Tripterygium wilfordii]|uniref:N-acetyltransferase domain-containing protein n=1 Tax=Tripterygium wilfordii TaxID=458696 RepID=A0A7J7CQU5_TRIWF|nr:uncharacterized N-acetyltransferase ycf52 [Tripterygium wilfordii]KAF5736485.1 hypothetical protein HS088_TW14G00628 [Tripterygium wilfordii]